VTLTMRASSEAIVITRPVRGCSVRRYYDPQTGQFINVDPAVDQTEAPYAYVSGDPVDGVDPLGLGCVFGLCTHSFDPMASLDAIVNIGRGATFGLTDQIANWIVPGASCTVPQNSLDQFLGSAATTLLGGEALGALLRSGPFGEFLARIRAIDLADETGSIGPDGGMLGEGGTQVTSRTLLRDTGQGFRIDVENPAPGVRPGQLHLQDAAGGKYLFNFGTNQFEGLPPGLARQIADDPQVASAIARARAYLNVP
jgi:hypothetical protein